MTICHSLHQVQFGYWIMNLFGRLQVKWALNWLLLSQLVIVSKAISVTSSTLLHAWNLLLASLVPGLTLSSRDKHRYHTLKPNHHTTKDWYSSNRMLKYWWLNLSIFMIGLKSSLVSDHCTLAWQKSNTGRRFEIPWLMSKMKSLKICLNKSPVTSMKPRQDCCKTRKL